MTNSAARRWLFPSSSRFDLFLCPICFIILGEEVPKRGKGRETKVPRPKTVYYEEVGICRHQKHREVVFGRGMGSQIYPPYRNGVRRKRCLLCNAINYWSAAECFGCGAPMSEIHLIRRH